MGDPKVTGINGAADVAAGTLVVTENGEQQFHPDSVRSGDDRPIDRVEGRAPARATTAVGNARTQELTELEAARQQIAALESDLQGQKTTTEANLQAAREAARNEKADRVEADNEKGWMFKGLLELLILFLRIFFPIINLISLAIRLLRIGYKLAFTEEKIDWKRDGMLMLGDLAGTFLPVYGGIAAAGIHGYMATSTSEGRNSEDKHDLLGWERSGPSGLAIGWQKLRGFTSGTYNKILGKDDRPAPQATDMDAARDDRAEQRAANKYIEMAVTG